MAKFLFQSLNPNGSTSKGTSDNWIKEYKTLQSALRYAFKHRSNGSYLIKVYYEKPIYGKADMAWKVAVENGRTYNLTASAGQR